MTVRSVVLTEHVHSAEDLDTGRVHRHEDLRLPVVRGRLRTRHDHDDHDLAAGVAGTRDVVLLAVDHPLVAVELGTARDVGGVGRRDVGLGHRVRRADLTREQRLEPRPLLLGCAHPLEHLHVARVGCRAVEDLGRDRVLAELRRDVRVVEVRETDAGRGVGEEEVPEPGGTGLRLQAVEDVELTLAVAPVLRPVRATPVVLLGRRVDLGRDEGAHGVVQRDRARRHPQVHRRVARQPRVHSWCRHDAPLAPATAPTNGRAT